MKKILLLGGSAQQIVAIEKAKELGYYTVLCDYLPDNPGQYHADKFYQVSTTDKEAVLEIARKECINGIIAYASDPAAPTAAYVAEILGLPGNPYYAVDILCNKDKFRNFLAENGFHSPGAHGCGSVTAAMEVLHTVSFPVIIKPVDSSGSKGATVLYNLDGAESAVQLAFQFSRCKRIIIEDYIQKKHPYLVGGDIFVKDGKIVIWGLLNCHRDERVNSLVPVGKSYPLMLTQSDIQRIKQTLQRLVDCLHIQRGAVNVELIVDAEDRVWLIDIGPRNGGNMIPDLLGMIFDVNVVELSVLTSMGRELSVHTASEECYYATHNLHSDRDGVFDHIEISPMLRKYMVRECIYKEKGDRVEYFDNASKALGILFMKFESLEEMQNVLASIHENIKIVMKEEGLDND